MSLLHPQATCVALLGTTPLVVICTTLETTRSPPLRVTKMYTVASCATDTKLVISFIKNYHRPKAQCNPMPRHYTPTDTVNLWHSRSPPEGKTCGTQVTTPPKKQKRKLVIAYATETTGDDIKSSTKWHLVPPKQLVKTLSLSPLTWSIGKITRASSASNRMTCGDTESTTTHTEHWETNWTCRTLSHHAQRS